jgi:predicted lipoprotein with Yx(FWY)xxD motif
VAVAVVEVRSRWKTSLSTSVRGTSSFTFNTYNDDKEGNGGGDDDDARNWVSDSLECESVVVSLE